MSEAVEALTKILYKVDPAGLASLNLPENEYDIEAKAMLAYMKQTGGIDVDAIQSIFGHWLGIPPNAEICHKILTIMRHPVNSIIWKEIRPDD